MDVKKKCRKGIRDVEKLIEKADLTNTEKEHITFCIKVYKKTLNIYDTKLLEPSVLLFCSIIEGIANFNKPRPKKGEAKKRFVDSIIDVYPKDKIKKHFKDLNRCYTETGRLDKWPKNNTELKVVEELLKNVYRDYRCEFTHGMKRLPFEVPLMSCVETITKPVYDDSEIILRMPVNELAEITLIVLRDFVKRRVNNQ